MASKKVPQPKTKESAPAADGAREGDGVVGTEPAAPIVLGKIVLPEDLAALVHAYAEALKLVSAGLVALETSTPEEKVNVTTNLQLVSEAAEAAEAAIGTWLTEFSDKRLRESDAWIDEQLVNKSIEFSLKVKAFDEDAANQLEQKRAELAQQLATVDNDIAASRATHTTPSEDQGGSGDTAAPAAGEALIWVEVKGPAAGRWRIGRKFGSDPVQLAVTSEERELLLADPTLSVDYQGE
jgi:hypothetical protein